MDILSELTFLAARDRMLRAAREGRTDVESPADKTQALHAAACVLREARVPFMLIGGVAVAVHTGLPRATLDVDLAVLSTADRVALVAAFIRAGFVRVGEFTHTVNLRHSSGEPVQLAFDGSFDDAIERAETFDVLGLPVPIARRGDLIALKERAAKDPKRRRSKSLRDQADVELLRGDVPDPDEGW